jgi:dienelactone hydrolase
MMSRPTSPLLRLIMIAAAIMLAMAARPALADPAAEKVKIIAGENELAAVLYRPQGPGPFPAIVALHGCGGLFNHHGEPSARHDDWGRHLSRQGFLVLMPDSFGSRGLASQCGVMNRLVRPGRERVADAQAAKDWLQARPDVKPDAVSLLGWSNGASTVLAAVRADRIMTAKGPDFARAVAFYPGCRNAVESGRWSSRLPLLILMGDADDWTPPGPCEELARSARTRAEPVDLVLYKGAYHNFDHPSLEPRTRTGLAFTADGSGTAHVGTDPEARADALVKVPDFLRRAR